MKRLLVSGAVVIVAVFATASAAYEPGTHGKMSDSAAQRSVLVIPSTATNTTELQDLGLSAYADTSQKFTDIQNGETVDLGPDGSDPFTATSPIDIQQLIRTGAQLEDESGLFTGRPLNHFFDPISGLPLNYTFLGEHYQSNYDAPDWAATSHCAGSSQTGPYSPSGDGASDTNQCFSVQDALSYFYNALTSPQAADRMLQFGNLFLTLGHLMHLVQDMAQPQHVRNDPHCDVWECYLVGKYNPSRYEALTYGPTGANIPGFAGQYGTVSFPTSTVRDFWSNSANSGLAQYTNNNFFSAGSLGLYGGAGLAYSAPKANGEVKTETIQQVLSDLGRKSNPQIDTECPDASPCNVTFVATTVHDKYKNLDTVNPKAAAVSLFSEDLTKEGDSETFSLNDATYEAAWQFLIPAAIDYSTGLVNYFFRGRLDVQPDTATPGNYLVINKSPYQMSGTVQFYYDAADGTRYPVSDTDTPVNLAAATDGSPGGQVSIPVVPPTDPAPATSNNYVAVFNGMIGDERGVAGKFFKPRNSDIYIASNGYNCETYDNNYCGLVTKYDANYSPIDAQGYIGSTFWVAAYDGAEYALNDTFATLSDGAQGCFAVATVNGTVFSGSDHNVCDQQSRYPYIENDALRVNSTNVYLFVTNARTSNNQTGSVDVYDHTGKYVSSVQSMPIPFVSYGFAVNDTNMCVSGYDNNGNGAAYLTDLQGAHAVALPADIDDGGGPCALSQDRLYIIKWPPDSDATLYVYNLSGTQMDAIDMNPGSDPSSTCGGITAMTATNTKVYIACNTYVYSQYTGYSSVHSLMIYDRIRTTNPDGTAEPDVYKLEPMVTLNQGKSDMYDIAVDMKNVLGTTGN